MALLFAYIRLSSVLTIKLTFFVYNQQNDTTKNDILNNLYCMRIHREEIKKAVVISCKLQINVFFLTNFGFYHLKRTKTRQVTSP